jgi:hypothetical protein
MRNHRTLCVTVGYLVIALVAGVIAPLTMPQQATADGIGVNPPPPDLDTTLSSTAMEPDTLSESYPVETVGTTMDYSIWSTVIGTTLSIL